jgi:transcriptional regulator with PAS, ATPase and Fis domain
MGALTQPQTAPFALAFSGTFGGRAESEALLRLLLRMLDHCRPDPDDSGRELPRAIFPDLVVPKGFVFAQSESMRQLYSQMQTLAQGDLAVLVIGDTGVGKEYLAQILHQSSKRRSGPFEAINCAAIPAELLESELFGIGEKVATGVSSRKGRFQLADGGTLFLDEIGDMSADLQAKLLRALQEKEVNPVGERPVRVDVRVIAATNQELNQRIQEGSFRSDLYYRLAGYLLEVPPLCQRPEDVPDLVEHYLKDCAKQLDKTFRGMTIRALKMLVDYPWPGNVRELQNEVRRLVYSCPAGQAIDSSHLSKTIQLHTAGEHPATIELPVKDLPVTGAPVGDISKTDNGNAPHQPGQDTLELGKIELQAIEEALRLRDGNQTKAAILLGITRQKLRRRMKIFGLL